MDLLFYSKIVDKIDRDQDGYVTFDELRSWIIFTQKKYLIDDVNKQWQTHNVEGHDKITWDVYRKAVYGFSNGELQYFPVHLFLGWYVLSVSKEIQREREIPFFCEENV